MANLLNGLPKRLAARVARYAETRGLTLPAAVAALVTLGLAHVRGVSKGGKARARALTPTRRSAIAKAAAQARWTRVDFDDESYDPKP